MNQRLPATAGRLPIKPIPQKNLRFLRLLAKAFGVAFCLQFFEPRITRHGGQVTDEGAAGRIRRRARE